MTEEKIVYDTGDADKTDLKDSMEDRDLSVGMTPEEQKKAGYSNYVYNGRCIRVVDGDTYDILVDCGFAIYHKIRVRLRGVDTPEKYGKNACEEGKQISEEVNEILFDNEVMIRTYKNKPTSFNRWEADVFFKDENGIVINLAKFLLANGKAEHVEGYQI